MINDRNNSHLSNVECVIGDLRECVAEYRWRGVNTVGALQLIADAWGVANRRLRTLFYRDQGILVGITERHDFALKAAALLHRIADENEERAQRCRDKAEAIRNRENEQLSLPLSGENKKWRGCGVGSDKRAA